jgi:leader peptidase (prepilin peptidase)/N-methyltransferase
MKSVDHVKPGQILSAIVLCGVVLVSLMAAPGLDGLLGAFLAGTALAIAIVDARSYRIPNELTLAVLALALLRASLVPSETELHPVAYALLRAVVTSGLFYTLAISYRHFRGREGFGFGDVKLLGAAAAWLDWPALLVAIEGATLAALATYLLRQWFYQRPMKTTAILPFGTFLAPFIWVGWLVEPLLN